MYKIYNNKDNETYYKEFDNYNDCYHWVVNHLDLSKEWSVDSKVKRLVTETNHINEDLSNCDGCNKFGSFTSNFPNALYGAEFDKNVYCNNCIPEAWERMLEGGGCN
jgi:hypothetical protein|tara:strand:+ start:237 stop:557 length:321 start_codon:yes stop_codon:yes gene_type:complete